MEYYIKWGKISLMCHFATIEPLSRRHMLVALNQKKKSKFVQKMNEFSELQVLYYQKDATLLRVQENATQDRRLDDITFKIQDGNFQNLDLSIHFLLLHPNFSFTEVHLERQFRTLQDAYKCYTKEF